MKFISTIFKKKYFITLCIQIFIIINCVCAQENHFLAPQSLKNFSKEIYSDPLELKSHPFQYPMKEMPYEHYSFLNRHQDQMIWIKKYIFPHIIERSKLMENKIYIVVMGASTGEELARIFYEIVTFLIKMDEDINKWEIIINGIENNQLVFEEAQKRLSGLSPFVWSSGKNKNSSKDIKYAKNIIYTLNKYRTEFQSYVKVHLGDITDNKFLKIFKNPDIVLANGVLEYLSKNERINLISYLDTWENSWIAHGSYIADATDTIIHSPLIKQLNSGLFSFFGIPEKGISISA